MGMQHKVETLPEQDLAGSAAVCLTRRDHRCQNTPVPGQNVIYPAHDLGIPAVTAVIIGITAGVVTEFFVNAASQGATALQALSFSTFHNNQVTIFMIISRLQTIINVYKRLYPIIND